MHILQTESSDFLLPNAGLPTPPAGREVWDYVEVRDGAHMFWWLYYADSQNADYQDLPLVMWLQVGKQITHLHWSRRTSAVAITSANKKNVQGGIRRCDAMTILKLQRRKYLIPSDVSSSMNLIYFWLQAHVCFLFNSYTLSAYSTI